MRMRSSRLSTNTMLLLHTRSLKALNIPQSSLKQGANQAGKATPSQLYARSISSWVDLQSNESKSLKRALQTALINTARRVRRTSTIELVVLRREDERREPEVRHNPGQKREVAFVLPDRGQSERGEV
jgi:hypothetical protein